MGLESHNVGEARNAHKTLMVKTLGNLSLERPRKICDKH
jgi:hypothetical protein